MILMHDIVVLVDASQTPESAHAQGHETQLKSTHFNGMQCISSHHFRGNNQLNILLKAELCVLLCSSIANKHANSTTKKGPSTTSSSSLLSFLS